MTKATTPCTKFSVSANGLTLAAAWLSSSGVENCVEASVDEVVAELK